MDFLLEDKYEERKRNTGRRLKRTVVSLQSATNTIDVALNAIFIGIRRIEIQTVGLPQLTTTEPIVFVTAPPNSVLLQQSNTVLDGLSGSVPSECFLNLPQPSSSTSTLYLGTLHRMEKNYQQPVSLDRITLSVVKTDGSAVAFASGKWTISLIFYSEA